MQNNSGISHKKESVSNAEAEIQSHLDKAKK